MSWLSQNYEKAALGGAAVIALGLGALGYLKTAKVEEDFATALSGTGKNDASVKEADKVKWARNSLTSPRKLERAEVGERPVDLFTSVPLFVSRSAPAEALDLVTGPPVHPPIPNTWWLEYRLDPGFADSPQRDADNDGFSNLEEFEAKTDPTDPAKFPSLIAKLRFVRDESVWWNIRPGFESEGGYTFKYRDSLNQTNSVNSVSVVKPGGLFFEGDPGKSRFKYLGSETRNIMNPRTKSEEPTVFVRVEDQKPNKKGKIYEIPQHPESQISQHVQYDRTAILSLDALGQSGSEFKVEENVAFALPASAPKKDYLLKSVTPESVEVEYLDADGSKKTVQIPKR